MLLLLPVFCLNPFRSFSRAIRPRFTSLQAGSCAQHHQGPPVTLLYCAGIVLSERHWRLFLCFSAFPCGFTLITADRCIQYAEVLWNAMWGAAATSQYLNGTALEMVIMRGAMYHGVDGLFMWGSGSRECGAAWLCNGTGTCSGGTKTSALGAWCEP